MQPQRLSSSLWASRDDPLMTSTRGFRQARDHISHLVLQAADQMAYNARVIA